MFKHLFLLTILAVSTAVHGAAPLIYVDKERYLLTAATEDGSLFEQRVIVGRKSRPTPSMTVPMTHIVFNPSWTVPVKLARLDLVPKFQKDPDAIERLGFRFFTDFTKTREIDPSTIDWHSFNRDSRLPFVIVQQPGPNNSLGRVKFILTNPRSIYLHGTPHSYLFDYETREFSSGCIRVENPLQLAQLVIHSIDVKEKLERLEGREQWVRLENPVLVEIGP